MEVLSETAPSLLFSVVFGVVATSALNVHLFMGRPGRLHRFLGLAYLGLLAAGLADVLWDAIIAIPAGLLVFHAILGVSGTLLALSASWAFNHRHVENPASGTLDSHALVTNSEMVEHAFYQGLNVAQVLFLHAVDALPERARLAGALAVQAPWLIRHLCPVNRFSDNYKQRDPQSNDLVRFLYRIKKCQYLFLKHALVFGLDIGVALRVGPLALSKGSDGAFAHSRTFRIYWLLLNASFVFEFFMQTLVRRHLLSQAAMLRLQQLLMLAASLAVVRLLGSVHVTAAAASLALNFAHRKHDFANSCLVIGGLLLQPLVASWL